MIKQKLKEFFFWIKDHFHFLVEVVLRLSVGIEEKENPTSADQTDNLNKGGKIDDK